MACSTETGHGRVTKITKATKITKTHIAFVIFVIFVSFVVFVSRPWAVSPQDESWPVHGGEGNIRYSGLTQINKSNVGQLQVAWTYDSKDAFKGSEMQSNPIVVDGVL